MTYITTEYEAEVAARQWRGTLTIGVGEGVSFSTPVTILSYRLEGYSADVMFEADGVPVISWTPQDVTLETDPIDQEA